jgi:TATA-binding protein-associated factor Taf7
MMLASLFSSTTLVVLTLLQSSSAESMRNVNAEFHLPEQNEWMSLTQTVDFMPADSFHTAANVPLVRRAQKRFLNYYKEEFADGLETQYNDYAQAWRYLGLFTDCNAVAQDNKRRYLDEANADEEAAAEDEANDEAEQAAAEEEVADDGSVCKRYLLWAAVSTIREHEFVLISFPFMTKQ